MSSSSHHWPCHASVFPPPLSRALRSRRSSCQRHIRQERRPIHPSGIHILPYRHRSFQWAVLINSSVFFFRLERPKCCFAEPHYRPMQQHRHQVEQRSCSGVRHVAISGCLSHTHIPSTAQTQSRPIHSSCTLRMLPSHIAFGIIPSPVSRAQTVPYVIDAGSNLEYVSLVETQFSDPRITCRCQNLTVPFPPGTQYEICMVCCPRPLGRMFS